MITRSAETRVHVKASRRRVRSACGVLLAIHAVCLGYLAYNYAPTLDEVGHFAAGEYSWHTMRFDVYRVNPPLVRLLAAAPVALCRPKMDWSQYRNGPGDRPEWILGREFVRLHDDKDHHWFGYFVVARWATIPLCILGGFICFRWATELYGLASGFVALTLWCCSPNILAWGATICPDAGAAATGVAASYCYWLWLREPRYTHAIVAGVSLGIAELTKTTWIIFVCVWPLLWGLWHMRSRKHGAKSSERRPKRELLQLALIFLLGLYVLNVGYAFEGSFHQLDDYTFVSRTLAGNASVAEGGQGGNRFRGGLLGSIRIPLPENYVRGIDLQKLDFEMGKWSYLCGEWRLGGWWYYYIVGLLLKVPLGAWVLGIMALSLSFRGLHSHMRAREERSGAPGYSSLWRNEVTLLAPAIAVFLLVSLHTGFNRYLRYVLPCFPFLFIWVSKVAQSSRTGDRKITAVWATALAWFVGSSVWIYPHSMSYFNELAGGPIGGHRYLIDANIDWGQDMWYLKLWLDRHPEAGPLKMAYVGFLSPKLFGIAYEPLDATGSERRGPSGESGTTRIGPVPGWYSMSIHRIHDRSGEYLGFLHFRPTARVGYSTYIFKITAPDVDRQGRMMETPVF